MEDEDKNSKSLVLITRVGSTPTTGIEKEALQLVWGLSLSAACERVEQHNLHGGEQSALDCTCAGDPHHRHKSPSGIRPMPLS